MREQKHGRKVQLFMSRPPVKLLLSFADTVYVSAWCILPAVLPCWRASCAEWSSRSGKQLQTLRSECVDDFLSSEALSSEIQARKSVREQESVEKFLIRRNLNARWCSPLIKTYKKEVQLPSYNQVSIHACFHRAETIQACVTLAPRSLFNRNPLSALREMQWTRLAQLH